MARRSLKPQLNQIRSWVQQGRTDAWIAHQLDVSVGDLVSFKREHELAPPEADPESSGDGARGPIADEEQDLREQDEALIAAALDAEPEEAEEEKDEAGDGGEPGEGDDRPRRRRGRRGGRARRGRKRGLEGTFDHGEEGYGLWLDPAIQDDPVYAEHWAGHRPVAVTVEQNQIVIRRAGADGAEVESDDSDSDADGASSGDAGGTGGGDGGGETAGPDPDAFDA